MSSQTTNVHHPPAAIAASFQPASTRKRAHSTGTQASGMSNPEPPRKVGSSQLTFGRQTQPAPGSVASSHTEEQSQGSGGSFGVMTGFGEKTDGSGSEGGKTPLCETFASLRKTLDINGFILKDNPDNKAMRYIMTFEFVRVFCDGGSRYKAEVRVYLKFDTAVPRRQEPIVLGLLRLYNEVCTPQDGELVKPMGARALDADGVIPVNMIATWCGPHFGTTVAAESLLSLTCDLEDSLAKAKLKALDGPESDLHPFQGRYHTKAAKAGNLVKYWLYRYGGGWIAGEDGMDDAVAEDGSLGPEELDQPIDWKSLLRQKPT